MIISYLMAVQVLVFLFCKLMFLSTESQRRGVSQPRSN